MIHQIGIHSLCKFGARSIKARGSLGSYDTTKNVICKGCSGGFCPLEMENPNEPTNAGFDGNEVAAQAKLESKHGLIVDQRRFVHLIYRYWSFCLKLVIQFLFVVFQMISDMHWIHPPPRMLARHHQDPETFLVGESQIPNLPFPPGILAAG